MKRAKGNPLIIAHRGASAEAPENTMAAFKLAVEQGCDAIELDIHLSADKHFIVCHDNGINRTTNGSGKISELTVDELKSYDAGAWFHEKYKGERIPLLEEVFDHLPQELIINVEVKDCRHGIERMLIDLLVRQKRLHTVVVSSFDHQFLHRLQELDKGVKIGLLYMAHEEEYTKYTNLFEFPVYSLHPHEDAILQEEIKKATKNGLEVFPWTVNDEQSMRTWIQNGVTGIITDHPHTLKKIVYG